MNNPLKENKMATTSVTKLVISMSLPPIISMFIQAMYNVVDSIFVSRISMDALTAVSLAFPMQQILVALFVGTGAGITSLISRRLGEGNNEAASKAANHGIIIYMFYSVIMAIVGMFFVRNFVASFTQDANLQNLTQQYLEIILIASFGNFMLHAGISILQSTGNTFMPMITQIVGAVINIVLDPILIFGLFGFPTMGIRGAALATVIGQIIACALVLIILFKDKNHLHITLKNFTLNYITIRDIYVVGLPATIMQSLASIMVSGLNLILISFSSAAVSILGIYFKLQSFVFMPIFGLAQGFRPIIGYNFGAKNKTRVLETLSIALKISISIMIVGTIIFQLFPKPLLALFDSNAEMIYIGVYALRIISVTFVFTAISITISVIFQATGRGVISLLVSFIRQIVLLLPSAFILSRIWGLNAVWYSFVISEIFALIIFVPSLYFYLKGEFSKWQGMN